MTRRHIVLLGAGLAFAVAVVAALAWFQPWKLVIDHRVDEALPPAATEILPSPAARTGGTSPSPGSRRAVLLSRGRFVSHEHATSGTVSVVRQPDGSRVLAIADLRTSDGPDVHVWLTDRPVRADRSNWHVFDDGEHVSLGTLKGNLGNQLYPIPDDADLGRLTSVSIWCDRFDVSFGAAELRPVAA
jgi:hypothetical protein